MTILVFGHTGQVAVALRKVLPQGRFLGRAEADLTDPRACHDMILATRPEAVINAAAFTAVDQAEQEEALAHVINAEAPSAMAQACAALEIPFLHVSTDYVFDGSGARPWQVGDVIAPLNAYGRSKAAGEAAVRAADGPHAILRTSWVFSETGKNFVTTMLRLSESRDSLQIVNDQIGGPTPASAIAEALVDIAQKMCAGEVGGTYHFAGQPFVSWECFARETFACAGRKIEVTGIPTSDYPTPAKRPLNSRLDCTGLETDFGISQPEWRRELSRIVGELI